MIIYIIVCKLYIKQLLSTFHSLSFSLFSPSLCPAGLCRPRLVPVADIWASRTVQYPAPTLRRAQPLVTYSRIPTNNHPAITNTNRYSKVRLCACVAYSCACKGGGQRSMLKYRSVLQCLPSECATEHICLVATPAARIRRMVPGKTRRELSFWDGSDCFFSFWTQQGAVKLIIITIIIILETLKTKPPISPLAVNIVVKKKKNTF